MIGSNVVNLVTEMDFTSVCVVIVNWCEVLFCL